MSQKDLDRFHVLKMLENKSITQVKAAELLNISDRQVRTLVRRLEAEGPAGIVHRLLGRPGNRRITDSDKQLVLQKISEQYANSGPTYINDKLSDRDGITLSRQTVRNWMVEAGLWRPKGAGERKLHLPRPRRECFGELIQVDGSYHRWFGPDRPKACLTVFIDDATGMLTALVFTPTECAEGYYAALEQHLKAYGRPMALYADRWSSFREAKDASVPQIRCALELMKIELILALSPQAKGRVERVNRTLQDRLIKDMELDKIYTIEAANAYLVEWLKDFNRHFSKKPMSAVDAHRPLEGYDLDRVLCPFEIRSLSSSGTFQFNKAHYVLQDAGQFGRLAKRKIEVRLTRCGKLRFFLKDVEVKALPLREVMVMPIQQQKIIGLHDHKREVVSPDHPWKRDFARATRQRCMEAAFCG